MRELKRVVKVETADVTSDDVSEVVVPSDVVEDVVELELLPLLSFESRLLAA